MTVKTSNKFNSLKGTEHLEMINIQLLKKEVGWSPKHHYYPSFPWIFYLLYVELH